MTYLVYADPSRCPLIVNSMTREVADRIAETWANRHAVTTYVEREADGQCVAVFDPPPPPQSA